MPLMPSLHAIISIQDQRVWSPSPADMLNQGNSFLLDYKLSHRKGLLDISEDQIDYKENQWSWEAISQS